MHKVKKCLHKNFGYIPSYSLKTNIISFLFGVPNLLKRFQAKSIFNTLRVRSMEKILDFGCGSGFLTVELYRAGAKAWGVDVHRMQTHNALKDCYGIDVIIVDSGIKTPYESDFFDKIIASEVLAVIENPDHFLKELHRILKPGGQFFIINGLGPFYIKKIYDEKKLLCVFLRFIFKSRFPNTYEDYVSSLNKFFGNAKKNFLTLEYIKNRLTSHNYEILECKPVMKASTSNKIAFLQFLYYLFTGNVIFKPYHFYIFFPFLRFFEMISGREMCDNHFIIRSKKV